MLLCTSLKIRLEFGTTLAITSDQRMIRSNRLVAGHNGMAMVRVRLTALGPSGRASSESAPSCGRSDWSARPTKVDGFRCAWDRGCKYFRLPQFTLLFLFPQEKTVFLEFEKELRYFQNVFFVDRPYLVASSQISVRNSFTGGPRPRFCSIQGNLMSYGTFSHYMMRMVGDFHRRLLKGIRDSVH